MKRIIFNQIVFSLLLFVSCTGNLKQEILIDNLLNEKNREIEEKYSTDLASIEYVKKDAIKLNKFFDGIIKGNKSYYDSIISIWQLNQDTLLKNQMLKFTENIPNNICEIKMLHYKSLCSLIDYYNDLHFKTMGVYSKVNLEKSRIKAGDTLKADIFLAMQITEYKDYSVIVNGDTLKRIENGIAVYKECFKKPGKFNREGKILIRANNKMKMYVFSFNVDVEN